MRRMMTAIGLILGGALAVALPGQSEAGSGFKFGSGPGVSSGHEAGPLRLKPRAGTPWVEKRPEPRGGPHHRRDRDRHHRRDYYRSPYLGHYGGTYYAAPTEPVAPPVAAAPPEPEPPAPPPDPRGPLFLSPARGAEAADDAWQVGDALPTGVPQVTLDWRSYDLPEPPAGRIYARVGRTVLLITASDRVIESVLPPR